MSRVGLPSIAAHVVAGLEARLRGRGVVAGGDHAEVVPPCQLDADVAFRQRLA